MLRQTQREYIDMIQYCYVKCYSWVEVRQVQAMCMVEGYKFSIDHQSLMLTYWRQP